MILESAGFALKFRVRPAGGQCGNQIGSKFWEVVAGACNFPSELLSAFELEKLMSPESLSERLISSFGSAR